MLGSGPAREVRLNESKLEFDKVAQKVELSKTLNLQIVMDYTDDEGFKISG